MKNKDPRHFFWETLDVEGHLKGRPIRLQAKIANPFNAKGMWLKANLHCHVGGVEAGRSCWADEATGLYHEMGYKAIAGMDHNICVPTETDLPMLVVPGAELSPGHLLALGVDTPPGVDPAADRFTATLKQIRETRKAGGMAVLAHPFNSNWTIDEITAFAEAGLEGLEVFNTASLLKGGTDRADQLWHLLHAQGVFLSALGVDDAHGPEDIRDPHMSPRLGWTGVYVDSFSVDSLLDALRAGRCYASEGPVLQEIQLNENGILDIHSSPVAGCYLRSGGGPLGGISLFPPNGSANAKHFRLDLAQYGYRFQSSMTIVLEDEQGRRAWVSPIRMETTFAFL